MTGDVAGTDAETFLEESGCRWLAKPFRLGELLQSGAEIRSAELTFDAEAAKRRSTSAQRRFSVFCD